MCVFFLCRFYRCLNVCLQILDKVRTVQAELLAKNALFERYLQPPPSQHITILLAHYKKEQFDA